MSDALHEVGARFVHPHHRVAGGVGWLAVGLAVWVAGAALVAWLGDAPPGCDATGCTVEVRGGETTVVPRVDEVRLNAYRRITRQLTSAWVDGRLEVPEIASRGSVYEDLVGEGPLPDGAEAAVAAAAPRWEVTAARIGAVGTTTALTWSRALESGRVLPRRQQDVRVLADDGFPGWARSYASHQADLEATAYANAVSRAQAGGPQWTRVSTRVALVAVFMAMLGLLGVRRSNRTRDVEVRPGVTAPRPGGRP